MTVSQYRKAAWNFTNGIGVMLFVISASMIAVFALIPPAVFFFDGASFTYILMGELQLLMYALASMTLSESHPVFEGTDKSKKGLTLSDICSRTGIYQLPAGRETIVRSYIGIDRILSGMLFLSAALFGAGLIIKPVSAAFAVLAFLMYLFLSGFVFLMANSLRSGDGEKIAGVRKMVYRFVMAFFWIYVLFVGRLNEFLLSSYFSPLPSVICGILCIILGIVSMIIMSRLHKKLLEDCQNRSISGEFIERNDENA